jgi:hypothetical protein
MLTTHWSEVVSGAPPQPGAAHGLQSRMVLPVGTRRAPTQMSSVCCSLLTRCGAYRPIPSGLTPRRPNLRDIFRPSDTRQAHGRTDEPRPYCEAQMRTQNAAAPTGTTANRQMPTYMSSRRTCARMQMSATDSVRRSKSPHRGTFRPAIVALCRFADDSLERQRILLLQSPPRISSPLGPRSRAYDGVLPATERTRSTLARSRACVPTASACNQRSDTMLKGVLPTSPPQHRSPDSEVRQRTPAVREVPSS